MRLAEEYVNRNCSRELKEVKNSSIANVKSVLTISERTIIYKYSEDGYERLNEGLRASGGQNDTEFGKLLDKVISKLPSYQDITYRATNLTEAELYKYIAAESKNSILVEHSFLSTSKSKAIAYAFGSTCQFRIFSRSGRDVSDFAKYGNHHPQNEKEVLFRPNCKFKVLEVTKGSAFTLITLEEIKSK